MLLFRLPTLRSGKVGAARFICPLLRSPIFFLCKPSNSSPSPLSAAVLPTAVAGMGKKPADEKKQTAAVKEAAAEGSKRGAELSKRRSEDVVFTPSNLSGPVLGARYGYLWGRPVEKGCGAPLVIGARKEVPRDSYHFFCAYFICGLCPPFSEFFEAIMNIYGLHLLEFMPNAMATMAIFVHLCENFVGVKPNVDLFRHYFVPRVENKAHRSGNISWMTQVARKSWGYIFGKLRERWDEWRGDWCWIQDEEAPE